MNATPVPTPQRVPKAVFSGIMLLIIAQTRIDPRENAVAPNTLKY